MTITNGLLAGVKYLRANAMGGVLEPALIVLHETAGRIEPGNAVNWLRSKACKVSAHVVIERDGSVTQMVPFNKRAFHAGKSTWQGRVGCNAFSIGIELVGPGKLDAKGKAWFGPCGAAGIQPCATPQHGDGFWLPFTDAQVKATIEVCQALVEEYPRCNQITTHWEISPGRKIDPNPLFPLDAVRKAVLDVTEAEDDDERPPADPVKPPMGTAAKTGIATGVGAVGAGGAVTISEVGQGVQVAKDAKGLVPPMGSFVWPALILAAGLIGAVLLYRRARA